ncbi:elongator complex protein 5-like [Orbicella faveolata]|uniref:elongator complex protein 5-like n=1 Tax=Orbicella faveolata TaxID=48498 RepID=UPI0009E3C29E|nr:elongator complex protein 5-like [Orbicella faveolata]
MLLGDIVNGKEKSHLVLVHDTVNQDGKPLLCCFVKSLLESADVIHAILWDMSPEQFIGAFDSHLRERIFCYDGFSDPLGWHLSRNDCDNSRVCVIHQNSNVAQVVKSNLASHSSQNSNPGYITKVAIVINSLSRLLLWKSSSTVCTLLNQLYSNPPDSQTGYQVVQVVGLVHTDLHDDQTLNAVNFLASSLLWMTQDLEQKNSDPSVSWCRILHKRKTGKVIRKVESFTLGDNYELTEHEEKDWNASSSTAHSEPLAVQEVDPTQNLTFNLKLTENERQARANLKLPYMYHEEKKSEVAVNSVGEGRVFYQPDEADDFDEDDPDDDLNI